MLLSSKRAKAEMAYVIGSTQQSSLFLNSLPADVLAVVFDFSGACNEASQRLVCSRWYQLILLYARSIIVGERGFVSILSKISPGYLKTATIRLRSSRRQPLPAGPPLSALHQLELVRDNSPLGKVKYRWITEFLQGLPALRLLSVSAHIAASVPVLPDLEELIIKPGGRIGDIRHLSNCTNLRTLSCLFSEDGLEQLDVSRMKELRVLSLSVLARKQGTLWERDQRWDMRCILDFLHTLHTTHPHLEAIQFERTPCVSLDDEPIYIKKILVNSMLIAPHPLPALVQLLDGQNHSLLREAFVPAHLIVRSLPFLHKMQIIDAVEALQAHSMSATEIFCKPIAGWQCLFFIICSRRYVPLLEKAMSMGIDPNMEDPSGYTALQRTLQEFALSHYRNQTFVDFICALIANGASPSRPGVLSYSFLNETVFKAVVEAGIDLSAKDDVTGNTMLQDALRVLVPEDSTDDPRRARQTSFEIPVSVLECAIGFGLDLNSVNKNGESALHMCRDSGTFLNLVRLGADITYRLPDGTSALHSHLRCASNPSLDLINACREKGITLDTVDGNRTSIAELLLQISSFHRIIPKNLSNPEIRSLAIACMHKNNNYVTKALLRSGALSKADQLFGEHDENAVREFLVKLNRSIKM